MSVTVEFRLEEDEDSPLGQFPDVSDGEMDRLEWYVVGGVRIVVDDKTVTRSPLAEDGYLNDYLWMVAKTLNSAIEETATGESSDVTLFDNPGNLEITPENEDLMIRFNSRTKEKQITELNADSVEFYRAVIDATDNLVQSLQSFNPSLCDSRLITGLEIHAEENRNELI